MDTTFVALVLTVLCGTAAAPDPYYCPDPNKSRLLLYNVMGIHIHALMHAHIHNTVHIIQ